jgi:hypothetical protein
MAQKVLVQLVDDLDGASSDDITTVQFGLDGVDYEIDLGSANAEGLRKIYAEYVEVARRTGGRLRRGTRPAGSAANPGEAGQVREWALANGYELSGRGRIPTQVIEAYKSAKEQEAQPKTVKAASKRRASAKKA